tara:strand:+ start:58 stop:231 length:174 start_codon:yes stop_codon:yes gene_type:complete
LSSYYGTESADHGITTADDLYGERWQIIPGSINGAVMNDEEIPKEICYWQHGENFQS